MKLHSSKRGFTLIEVLIVVTIVAILAGIVLPKLGSSTKDARESSLRLMLHELRTQIERYKVEHQGQLPDGEGRFRQLISATDAQGEVGTAGPAYPYGPYIQDPFPANPITGASNVTFAPGQLGAPRTSTPGDKGGWRYRPGTGEIWADHSQYRTW